MPHACEGATPWQLPGTAQAARPQCARRSLACAARTAALCRHIAASICKSSLPGLANLLASTCAQCSARSCGRSCHLAPAGASHAWPCRARLLDSTCTTWDSVSSCIKELTKLTNHSREKLLAQPAPVATVLHRTPHDVYRRLQRLTAHTSCFAQAARASGS